MDSKVHPRILLPKNADSTVYISKRTCLTSSNLQTLASRCVLRNQTPLITDCCVMVCSYLALEKQTLVLLPELHVYDTFTYNLLSSFVWAKHVFFHEIDIAHHRIPPFNPRAEHVTIDTCDKNFADYYARKAVFSDMTWLHLHRTPLRWHEHVPSLCGKGVEVFLSGGAPICFRIEEPYPPRMTWFKDNCWAPCCAKTRPLAHDLRKTLEEENRGVSWVDTSFPSIST